MFVDLESAARPHPPARGKKREGKSGGGWSGDW
jgi:hypothetical protein